MDAMTDDELPDELARALETLDERAAKRARAVDASRVARLVVERLRRESEQAQRPQWVRHWRAVAMAAAAAVVLAAVGVALFRIQAHRGAAPVASTALPVELDPQTLAEGQGEALLKAVEEIPAAAAQETEPAIGSVEELNEQELQTLLHDMEQLDSGGAL